MVRHRGQGDYRAGRSPSLRQAPAGEVRRVDRSRDGGGMAASDGAGHEGEWVADPLPDAVEPLLLDEQKRLYPLLRVLYGEDLNDETLALLARRVRRGVKGLVTIRVR